jgi:multidrug efflux pump
VQKLSQIQGVGLVDVGGGALPSVRVEANPMQLEEYGLTLSSIQSTLSAQNTDVARGSFESNGIKTDIITNGQISHAAQYKPLIIGYHNGAAVRLEDVAEVEDATSNVRAAGYLNGVPSITIIIRRQPGANIIETIDRIQAALPSLEDDYCSRSNDNNSCLRE